MPWIAPDYLCKAAYNSTHKGQPHEHHRHCLFHSFLLVNRSSQLFIGIIGNLVILSDASTCPATASHHLHARLMIGCISLGRPERWWLYYGMSTSLSLEAKVDVDWTVPTDLDPESFQSVRVGGSLS